MAGKPHDVGYFFCRDEASPMKPSNKTTINVISFGCVDSCLLKTNSRSMNVHMKKNPA
jgi:hypothetical protein